MYASHRPAPWIGSLAVHVGGFALLLWIGARVAPVSGPSRIVDLAATPLFAPRLQPSTDSGGGGGDTSSMPPSAGRLPKPTPRPWVPPQQRIPDTPPPLLLDAGIAIDELPAANPNLPLWGDPSLKIGPASGGPGCCTGIGNRPGKGGIGPGGGPGYGPGSAPGVYRVGGGVSAPVVVQMVEPDYSEDARKAKWQGSVLLSIIVDERGFPRDIKVVRPLGLGLDEKAVEAVSKWRFRPGTKDGRPVPVHASVEVNFRLL